MRATTSRARSYITIEALACTTLDREYGDCALTQLTEICFHLTTQMDSTPRVRTRGRLHARHRHYACSSVRQDEYLGLGCRLVGPFTSITITFTHALLTSCCRICKPAARLWNWCVDMPYWPYFTQHSGIVSSKSKPWQLLPTVTHPSSRP